VIYIKLETTTLGKYRVMYYVDALPIANVTPCMPKILYETLF